jgi:MTH538 TIR-like domain (DUF1863)
MTRRVFISYQHLDRMRTKGFNLMRYNRHLDLNFTGRHLLDPVNSENADYITRCIKQQLSGTSVTVVLIGERTAQSGWVDREITWSTEKSPPNGLVGIRLDPSAEVPRQLVEGGAEILDWNEPGDVAEFGPAIERAALAARRAPTMVLASGASCSR